MRLTDSNRLTHGVAPFRGVDADCSLTFVSSQLTSLQFFTAEQNTEVNRVSVLR